MTNKPLPKPGHLLELAEAIGYARPVFSREKFGAEGEASKRSLVVADFELRGPLPYLLLERCPGISPNPRAWWNIGEACQVAWDLLLCPPNASTWAGRLLETSDGRYPHPGGFALDTSKSVGECLAFFNRPDVRDALVARVREHRDRFESSAVNLPERRKGAPRPQVSVFEPVLTDTAGDYVDADGVPEEASGEWLESPIARPDEVLHLRQLLEGWGLTSEQGFDLIADASEDCREDIRKARDARRKRRSREAKSWRRLDAKWRALEGCPFLDSKWGDPGYQPRGGWECFDDSRQPDTVPRKRLPRDPGEIRPGEFSSLDFDSDHWGDTSPQRPGLQVDPRPEVYREEPLGGTFEKPSRDRKGRKVSTLPPYVNRWTQRP